jgi:hypothetical protein
VSPHLQHSNHTQEEKDQDDVGKLKTKKQEAKKKLDELNSDLKTIEAKREEAKKCRDNCKDDDDIAVCEYTFPYNK